MSQSVSRMRLGIGQDEQTTIAVNAFGEPMTPQRLGESFASFCKEHQFAVTFHSLRHTAAILMLTSGVDVKTAASRLGHARPTQTLNTYGHYIPEADKLAADKIAALLS